jgi:hypothetical protein
MYCLGSCNEFFCGQFCHLNVFSAYKNKEKFANTKAITFFFDRKSVIPRKREEIKNTRHSSGLGFNVMNINIIEPDEWPDE